MTLFPAPSTTPEFVAPLAPVIPITRKPLAPEFVAWPKTPRLFRDMIVTEKIDGTNAAVIVTQDGGVFAQSRKRLITPGKSTDNMGFAAWVEEHADELRDLGPGHHYGEWYGRGIQRGYGLDERRFALFNVDRYRDRPDCCDVVPVLHRGPFDTWDVEMCLRALRDNGSEAAPGYMNPEGVIVFHSASRQVYKALLENDDQPKGLAA